jgi:5,10-methylene-tetrahydrofolate dehydrogenase/methenyl tetrahydrofolate cyclohydrolase
MTTENATPPTPPASECIKIDGRATAKVIRAELAEHTKSLQASHGVTPGLAVVLVGSRTDSAVYVRMKKKAAAEVGFHSVDVQLPETATEAEILGAVDALNKDSAVHGILVQLPLPAHVCEATVLKRILVEKDVDGFSALNIGNLCLRGGDAPLAMPCTPAGCMELLRRYGIETSGKDAVVVGRSNIVGMPVAAMLQAANATVTVCHSRTKNLAGHVGRADIVVAALGRAEAVKASWLKPGAVVIDVGINEKPDASRKRGYRLVGDVEYSEARKVCSAITPVPGGVGPMTIAMLLQNTVNLARRSAGLGPLQ